ncbi:hypothetical protein QTV44_002481 [Vibrio vulnificus]|nr:hypothetical protein [Vibrio vulnificus]
MFLSIYDDEGTFQTLNTLDYPTSKEAAIALIDTLIDWSFAEIAIDSGLFESRSLRSHVSELRQLKREVATFDLEEKDWFATSLGFTFTSH